MKKSIVTGFLMLGLMFNSTVFAQEFATKEPEAGQKTYGNWANECDETQDTKKICYTSQTMLLKEVNQELLYIAVGFFPDVKEPVLVMTTPLKTFLPSGIMLQVDEQEADALPFEVCDKVGCHVRVGVKPETIEAFKKGTLINVTFRDGAGQKIKIPVSLSGFTKAFDSLKG